MECDKDNHTIVELVRPETAIIEEMEEIQAVVMDLDSFCPDKENGRRWGDNVHENNAVSNVIGFLQHLKPHPQQTQGKKREQAMAPGEGGPTIPTLAAFRQ
jgi:hypothetical protein